MADELLGMVAGIDKAVVLAEGKAPIPLAVTDGRASELKGAAPLLPNGHYTLRLTMRDRSDPVEVSFIATTSTDSGALVVLRVD